MDLVNELIVQAVSSPWLYLVMFATAIIDGFFPPVPSETVLVAAVAVASSTGGADLVLLGLVAAAGAAIGDNIAFSIGRGVGTTRFRWMRRPRIAASFAWAARRLEGNGAMLILGARYIPVGRVAVNMSAGALGFPRRRFVALSIIAGISWAAYSTGIGLIAGRIVDDHPLLGAAIGIAMALLAGFAIDIAARLRRRSAVEPVEAPSAERLPTSAGAPRDAA